MIMKCRRLQWADHVVSKRETTNAYGMSVEKWLGKQPPGKIKNEVEGSNYDSAREHELWRLEINRTG